MRTTSNRKSNAPERFAQIPSVSLPRSTFRRSSGHQTTFDSGFLIPIYVDEALPGDTHRVSVSSFVRLATPLTPIMDNLYLDVFFFAIPLRLLWDNFQKFMGEQDNPGDNTDFLTPIITSPAGGFQTQTIYDYMGIPPYVAGLDFTAFQLRAYNLVIKEWFRDENLQDSPPINKGDGPDNHTDYQLIRRGKRHDYFTSALPFPQKGPAVPLPLGGSAPLTGNPAIIPAAAPIFATSGAAGGVSTLTGNADSHAPNPLLVELTSPAAGAGSGVMSWSNPGLNVDISAVSADLSSATAATINTIRQAFQIQKLYERDARGGTRYTEIVRSHFGVISPDSRLQRPEYLGGGSSKINVHPIAATAVNFVPQVNIGSLGAFVTGGFQGRGYMQSFTEHSIVLGLAMVRADLRYQQGLNRMWSRRTRFDYYWPSFAHLGEQEVLSREIYADGTAGDDTVFGYQERYAEYRYMPSRISGRFRSQDPLSLDFWHVAQDFSARPLLNDAFIQENPPIDRVIAVPSEPQFLGDFWFDKTDVRPMPTYSVPGLVDHF